MSPLRAALLVPFFAFAIAAACGTATKGGGGGSASGGSGQCIAMGAPCTPTVDVGPDGGTTLVQPTCCEGQCAALPCCYSDCEGTCQPEGGLCCNSGSQCGEDSQCCSGKCLPDGGTMFGGGPQGTCM